MVSEGTFTASSTSSFIQLAVHSPTHISFNSEYLARLLLPLLLVGRAVIDNDDEGRMDEVQIAWRRD